MGTLFKQPTRNYHDIELRDLVNQIKTIKTAANEENVSTELATRIYATMVKERALNITVSDHDVKDEQLAGFGEILKQLVDAIEAYMDTKI